MATKVRYQTRAAKTPPFDAIIGEYLRTGGRPYIHICWMVHNHCNHRCSYYDKANWGGDHPWPTLESAKRFFEQVFRHYHDRKVVVSFTGGEPTLWPDFRSLVDWLHERKISLGMTSNGTMGAKYFAEISPKLDWLSLSFHPQFTNPEPFLETVLASSASPHLTVRLMMPPERRLWNRSMDFSKKIRQSSRLNRSISVEHVPIVDGFGSTNTKPVQYEADQSQEFARTSITVGPETPKPIQSPISNIFAGFAGPPKAYADYDLNQLVADGAANFFGWRCEIGREQLFIDSSGHILRAGCRVGGGVGHLNDADIQFPTAGIRCNKTFCHCVTDVIVTKASPRWDLIDAIHNKHDRIAVFRVLNSYGRFLTAHAQARLSRALDETHRLIKTTLPPRLYYTIRDGFRILRRPLKHLRSRASS